MDAQGLVKIINDAKDAADKSCFGPMFQYPDKHDISKRQVNQLAFNVFVIVLTALLRDIIKRGEKIDTK